jgi:hypothetical protein
MLDTADNWYYINVRENRKDFQELTFQRYMQHWTQDIKQKTNNIKQTNKQTKTKTHNTEN